MDLIVGILYFIFGMASLFGFFVGPILILGGLIGKEFFYSGVCMLAFSCFWTGVVLDKPLPLIG